MAASTVIAISGRRIDANDATEPRFPLERVPVVKQSLLDAFREAAPEAVVSAAACGADLLALDAAGELGLRRRVVLPTPVDRFRESSVVDRPGPWGSLFDRIIGEVTAEHELVTLELSSDDEGYRAGNLAILDAAAALGDAVQAWIVWNGRARDASDITLHFAREAWARRYPVREILTLPRADEPSADSLRRWLEPGR